jgi:hypothetical protein
LPVGTGARLPGVIIGVLIAGTVIGGTSAGFGAGITGTAAGVMGVGVATVKPPIFSVFVFGMDNGCGGAVGAGFTAGAGIGAGFVSTGGDSGSGFGPPFGSKAVGWIGLSGNVGITVTGLISAGFGTGMLFPMAGGSTTGLLGEIDGVPGGTIGMAGTATGGITGTGVGGNAGTGIVGTVSEVGNTGTGTPPIGAAGIAGVGTGAIAGVGTGGIAGVGTGGIAGVGTGAGTIGTSV